MSYNIAKLQWKRVNDKYDSRVYMLEAETDIGNYIVRVGDSISWWFGVGDVFLVGSIKEGKQQAQTDWEVYINNLLANWVVNTKG